MKALVTGGRSYCDIARLYWVLDYLATHYGLDEIVHGGARGADALAGRWAEERRFAVTAFPADWKKFGKAAGMIRNRRMLEEGRPALVVAFPGGKGTANMVGLAKRAGLVVLTVGPSEGEPPKLDDPAVKG